MECEDQRVSRAGADDFRRHGRRDAVLSFARKRRSGEQRSTHVYQTVESRVSPKDGDDFGPHISSDIGSHWGVRGWGGDARMSDTKFGSWSVAESPISIEYSLVVIEEIRHEVAEGFQRLSRGGIEVGGILYGTRDGRTVRVLAMRPIACEHARGPAFLLSDKDRVALNEQLVRDKDEPNLEGLIAVGWFLSHTRSEISLNESDQEIFSIFFPAPWQVTMVIRPGRGGSMRAGFFVREHDGTVRGESSYLEFNFPDRLAGVLDRTPRGERTGAERPGLDRPGLDRSGADR